MFGAQCLIRQVMASGAGLAGRGRLQERRTFSAVGAVAVGTSAAADGGMHVLEGVFGGVAGVAEIRLGFFQQLRERTPVGIMAGIAPFLGLDRRMG